MVNTKTISPKILNEILFRLRDSGKSIMVWGPPGVGKTEGVYQFAQRLRELTGEEVPLLDWRLASKTSSDVAGLSALNMQEMTSVTFIPEVLASLPRKGYSILFLDELPGAEEQTRIAAYGLILERRVGKFELPEKCIVIAAGNRLEDQSISADFGRALNDRFIHLLVDATVTDWIEHSNKTGISPGTLTYIQTFPTHLASVTYNHEEVVRVSPRSWTRTDEEYVKLVKEGAPKEVIEAIIMGIIGQGIGQHYLSFQEEMGDTPTVSQLLAVKPKEAIKMIPKRIGAFYNVLYALAQNAKEHPEQLMDGWNILRAIQTLPADGKLPVSSMQIDLPFQYYTMMRQLGLDQNAILASEDFKANFNHMITEAFQI